jgi:hypothetical protein
MIGGLLTSIVVFASGAVLRFAVAVNPFQHGLSLQMVGLILMCIAGAGMFLTALALVTEGDWRQYQSAIRDGAAQSIRQEDAFS